MTPDDLEGIRAQLTNPIWPDKKVVMDDGESSILVDHYHARDVAAALLAEVDWLKAESQGPVSQTQKTHGDLEHLMRVMAEADCSLEGVWPTISNGDLHILFNCNDFFYWGTADAEEYQAGDEDLLDSCLTDLKAADPDEGVFVLLLLFCARKRQMRPQYPFFRHRSDGKPGAPYDTDALKPAVRALFDALGPDGSDLDRG